MFAYPVLPVVLPHHLRLGAITLLTLFALLVCAFGLRTRRDRRNWLLAALLGTAFVTFEKSHTYLTYPERTEDTFLREAIDWTNILSWFALVAVSVVNCRRHPDATKGFIGVWACIVPALLLLGAAGASVTPQSASFAGQCRSQLKHLAIATASYAETYDGQYFPLRFKTVGGVERTWRIEVLPFLDAATLRKRYHDDMAWDSPENEAIARYDVQAFRCPSNERPADPFQRLYTAYLAVGGDGGLFGRARRWGEVPDGMSNTALMVEACGQNVVWTAPRDLDISVVIAGVNLPGTESGRSEGAFSAYHAGGPGVLMADGSARAIAPEMDGEVLRAILTVDGGETTSFD